jgi:hypothetical protein
MMRIFALNQGVFVLEGFWVATSRGIMAEMR